MIEVRNLCMAFEDKKVLKDVSTTLKPGMTNLIIGRSGAGKTVLLKSLIGLHTPTSGEILFDGFDICSLDEEGKKRLRHKMGVMFQGAALFDSLTVLGNVGFPLDMFSKLPRAQRVEKAMNLIRRVGLENAVYKYPSEISGGMMKRCAIARALVTDPKYLFCDEPNSGLDPKTGAIIDNLLAELTHEHGITTVINTHDMNSVRNIGENIVYLDKGMKNWEGSFKEIDLTGTPRLRYFINLS